MDVKPWDAPRVTEAQRVGPHASAAGGSQAGAGRDGLVCTGARS